MHGVFTKIPQDVINRIIEDYKNKKSVRWLSKEYGYAYEVIRKRLIMNGIKIRDHKQARQCFPMPRMEKSCHWKGGKIKSKGYIYIRMPDYHRITNNGYVAEHIYVWEKHYNKYVPPNMHIHHLNGNKEDNRIENLVAIKKGEHSSLAEPYKRRIKELEEIIKRISQPGLSYENNT
jgi:hypothetical protein